MTDRSPPVEPGPRAGPPLVLLHGLGGSAADWTEVAGAAAARAPALALNLPGHGGRTAQIRPLTIADLTADVVERLAEHQLGRVHLLGHSLGGVIALDFAIQYPKRCGALVLVATTPEAATVEERAASARLGPVLAAAIARAWVERPDKTPALGAITTATLIVVGEQDRPAFQRGAELLHGWMPNSRLVRIAGAGHHPQHDQPEAFTATLLAFLQEVDGQSIDDWRR